MSIGGGVEHSIFLSHNSHDKPIVRRLRNDLAAYGIRGWVDEAEIRPGESLIAKIQDGLESTDFFAVILSKRSVDSEWVKRELDMATTLELERKAVFVIPIVVDDCQVPLFLRGKKYLNISTDYLGSVDELECLVKRTPLPEMMTAAEAARCVKVRLQPPGEICAISQQGVNQQYGDAYPDWLFARLRDGRSRKWIVEYVDVGERLIRPFAVKDGLVDELPIVSIGNETLGHNQKAVSIAYTPNLDGTFAAIRMVRRSKYRPPKPVDFSYLDSDYIFSKAVGQFKARFSFCSGSLFFQDELGRYTWRITFIDASLASPLGYCDLCPLTGDVIRIDTLPTPIDRNEMALYPSPMGGWKVKIGAQFKR
jgi:hypothetical protein